MAFLDFLTGADEQQKELEKAQQELRRARTSALAATREGQTQATGALTQYLGPGANYGATQSILDDLSGANGPQAQADAFARYRESPEVAFYRDQGIEAARRGASAGGQGYSGRTAADLTKFGTGVATQAYGNYWDRLANMYQTKLGTAGRLGTGLADIATGTGRSLADIHTGMGSQIAGMGQQIAGAAGARGGVGGDLLSQGLAAAGYAAGAYMGRPPVPTAGTSASSFSRNAYPPVYGPQRSA